MEKTPNAPRSLILSTRLYQALLAVYPSEFRHAYGGPMLQVFRDSSQRALRESGAAGLLSLWSRTMLDTVQMAVEEHAQRGVEMTKEKLFKHGGYMTMAAMTFAPEEFRVGVNIFGVTNWLRTLKSIPPYWESFRRSLYAELGDPYTQDSVRLYRISPLFHAAAIKHPVMVLQGANDPRVLKVESDEIVAAMRANNIPVEYIVFPDEGHGFVKKENEIKGYGGILTFLDRHLR